MVGVLRICGNYLVSYMSKKEAVFYAVGVGRKPGIYNTWKECKSQVEGVTNPKFRKFYSAAEAQQFVNRWRNNGYVDKNITSTECINVKIKDSKLHCKETSSTSHNFSSNVDNSTHKGKLFCQKEKQLLALRESVTSCEKKLDACMNKIGTIVSELADVRRVLSNVSEIICETTVNSDGGKDDFKDNFEADIVDVIDCESDSDYETPTKKLKTRNDNDEEDVVLVKEKNEEGKLYPYEFTVEDGYVVVYTDGSCVSNGRASAKAGIGVWFGDNHPLNWVRRFSAIFKTQGGSTRKKNVSRPLSGKATNNCAETEAAITAIELALQAGMTKLKICTDSTYLLNCATDWIPHWKKNGWRTYDNKPVKNRENLEKLDSLTSKISVRWEKVPAHSGIKGNEMADELANAGAALYKNKLDYTSNDD